MKQYERISAPVGAGAATIQEASNTPDSKYPHLRVMSPTIPARDNSEATIPAMSIELSGDGVEDLYRFLKSYYEPSA